MAFATWDARQRRAASVGATVAAVVLVLFALLASTIAPRDVDTFLLAILVMLVAAAVFQALVVVTGLRQARAAAEAPAGAEGWAAPAPPAGSWAPPAAAEPITLKCGNCATVFDVPDTGQRPLRHTCPGCGAQGELGEAELGPAAAPPGPAAAAEPITLKCGNCATIFDVTDTGQRPLRHTCPGCGSEGVLREEDIGPAPALAAMAQPPSASATRPPAAGPAPAPRAGGKTVRTLKLRCKSCSTVFTLRDTGERPLYHECPGCKATGVLR